MKRADLFCTDSNFSLRYTWRGSQTAHEYSNLTGLICPLYAKSLTSSEHACRFLLSSPNFLYALLQVSSICLFRGKLLDMWTPKY